jgi:hypothetical protein
MFMDTATTPTLPTWVAVAEEVVAEELSLSAESGQSKSRSSCSVIVRATVTQ